MAGLGVHPRLAHMIVRSEALGQTDLAVGIAALLTERDILSRSPTRDPDLRLRVDAIARDGTERSTTVDGAALRRVRRVVEQL